MLNCYTHTADQKATPIIFVPNTQFSQWVEKQNATTQNWVKTCKFLALPETFCIIPDEHGNLKEVIVGVEKKDYFWNAGGLAVSLPQGVYQLEEGLDLKQSEQAVIAWGLGAYQFSHYKIPKKSVSQLLLPQKPEMQPIQALVETLFEIRDWINTPTEDMGPAQLGEIAEKIAKEYKATLLQIVGEDLIKKNFPTIYAVGRASTRPPRLIDLQWGNPKHPKVTLLGKGVCFDSGGLDIKNAVGMQLMKKDMAGGAHALGLAKLIMKAQLPVRLRVLVPVVENVIAGNAYRPGDIIKTRKGISVEVGNTDAEGRLILCDALAEGATDNPELMIDFSTLTGAARVAVGTDISAFFCNHEPLAEKINAYGMQTQDPVWRLPLYAPYRKMLDTPFADINNSNPTGYAGAITAALFLKEFVPDTIPWVHFDCMAWNLKSQPGRPEGAEVMGVRAVFAYLCDKYKNDQEPRA